MNKLISVLFFVMTLLIFTDSVAAKPIMVIVPDNTAVTLASSSSTTINYTVTNNTTQTQNNFTIYPAYDIKNKNAQKTATVIGNTCNTLAPNASCTFQVVLTGSNNLPATFIVSPRVCVYNNAVCSQPTLTNRVTVSVGGGASAKLAYIATQSSVLVCNILPNGDFVNCRNTGSNFNFPAGIALNPRKTLAYVTNINDATITKCTIAENGELIDCAQTAVGAGFTTPEGIALDPAGEIAYIGGFFFFWGCEVDSSGELINCTHGVDPDPVSNTYGVTVTPDNTLAYFTNLNQSNISICTILGGGNLNCAPPSSIASPNGIALTSDASTAYISKNGGLLSKCNIGTTLGACTDFSTGNSQGVALNFAETVVYVTNLNTSNGISKCTILPNGDVQTPCVPTGVCVSTEPNCFDSPTAIALK